MGYFSHFGRDTMLSSILIPEAHESFDMLWVALSTTPVDAMSPTSLTEPEGEGYARVVYMCGAEFWTRSGYSEFVNSQEIRWETATGPWGTLQGWALMTGSTGPQMVAGGLLSLSTSQVEDGWSVTIPRHALRLGQMILK